MGWALTCVEGGKFPDDSPTTNYEKDSPDSSLKALLGASVLVALRSILHCKLIEVLKVKEMSI